MNFQSFKRATTAGIFIVLLGLALNSCKSKSKKLYQDTDCQVLLKTKVESNWETPGFLKNADTVKFITTKNAASGLISVEAHLSQAGTIIPGSGIELSAGSKCAVKLPDNLVYSETKIALATLKIVGATGGLKSFNYIKLSPTSVKVEDKEYIAYDVAVVDSSGESSVGKADPCPPICIVPYEDPEPKPDPVDQ